MTIELFFRMDPRWSMGREDERMKLSKYCRQFCPLSDNFPQVAASTGGGGVSQEGGLVWVNLSVAGSELKRSGGRPIGQALTAQFHRRTPKEFPRRQVPLCGRFSSASFHRAAFHGGTV